MQAQAITDPCFSSGNFCEGRRFLSPKKLEGWGLMVAEQVGYIGGHLDLGCRHPRSLTDLTYIHTHMFIHVRAHRATTQEHTWSVT